MANRRNPWSDASDEDVDVNAILARSTSNAAGAGVPWTAIGAGQPDREDLRRKLREKAAKAREGAGGVRHLSGKGRKALKADLAGQQENISELKEQLAQQQAALAQHRETARRCNAQMNALKATEQRLEQLWLSMSSVASTLKAITNSSAYNSSDEFHDGDDADAATDEEKGGQSSGSGEEIADADAYAATSDEYHHHRAGSGIEPLDDDDELEDEQHHAADASEAGYGELHDMHAASWGGVAAAAGDAALGAGSTADERATADAAASTPAAAEDAEPKRRNKSDEDDDFPSALVVATRARRKKPSKRTKAPPTRPGAVNVDSSNAEPEAATASLQEEITGAADSSAPTAAPVSTHTLVDDRGKRELTVDKTADTLASPAPLSQPLPGAVAVESTSLSMLAEPVDIDIDTQKSGDGSAVSQQEQEGAVHTHLTSSSPGVGPVASDESHAIGGHKVHSRVDASNDRVNPSNRADGQDAETVDDQHPVLVDPATLRNKKQRKPRQRRGSPSKLKRREAMAQRGEEDARALAGTAWDKSDNGDRAPAIGDGTAAASRATQFGLATTVIPENLQQITGVSKTLAESLAPEAASTDALLPPAPLPVAPPPPLPSTAPGADGGSILASSLLQQLFDNSRRTGAADATECAATTPSRPSHTGAGVHPITPPTDPRPLLAARAAPQLAANGNGMSTPESNSGGGHRDGGSPASPSDHGADGDQASVVTNETEDFAVGISEGKAAGTISASGIAAASPTHRSLLQSQPKPGVNVSGPSRATALVTPNVGPLSFTPFVAAGAAYGQPVPSAGSPGWPGLGLSARMPHRRSLTHVAGPHVFQPSQQQLAFGSWQPPAVQRQSWMISPIGPGVNVGAQSPGYTVPMPQPQRPGALQVSPFASGFSGVAMAPIQFGWCGDPYAAQVHQQHRQQQEQQLQQPPPASQHQPQQQQQHCTAAMPLPAQHPLQPQPQFRHSQIQHTPNNLPTSFPPASHPPAQRLFTGQAFSSAALSQQTATSPLGYHPSRGADWIADVRSDALERDGDDYAWLYREIAAAARANATEAPGSGGTGGGGGGGGGSGDGIRLATSPINVMAAAAGYTERAGAERSANVTSTGMQTDISVHPITGSW